MTSGRAGYRLGRWWRTLPRGAGVVVGAVCATLVLASSARAAEDTPRDIVLVLDVSQSMDDAFSRVIAAIEDFTASTGPDETLTLATFGDGVNFITRRHALGPGARADLAAMLAPLAPTDRFTNITFAVDRALSEVRKLGPGEGRLREVIVLTDGKHNPPPGGRAPVPTFAELGEKARSIQDQVWYVRYIVLGTEDDPDMTAFARATGGDTTMLTHVLAPELQEDLTGALAAAWVPASVTIEAIQGGVLLERLGEEAQVPDVGASVAEGDRLLLGPDGYAILRTEENAHIGLNPETQWVLEQARRHSASGQVRIRGRVTRGQALATAADVPVVHMGLAGEQGAIHTLEGTIGLSVTGNETSVAASDVGASRLTYGPPQHPLTPSLRNRPVLRPRGAGRTAALRDPYPILADPAPLPGGSMSVAHFLRDWSDPAPHDVTWAALFAGWRPSLEGRTPLSAVAGAVLAAQQPPRLTDVVIAFRGTFEGDILSDDDERIILQSDAGLHYFHRREIKAVSYAAFPLSSGKVEEIVGTAEFQREGRADTWRELIVGTKLRPGDRVRTGPDSKVICTVAGQVVVSINPESELTLADARRDSTTGDVRVRVALDDGQLWSDAGHLVSRRSRYTVETPQASCGVRGTVFTVVYDTATEESTVATVEGEVAVVQKAEQLAEVAVAAQQQTTVVQDAAPVAAPIEAVHVREWQQAEKRFELQRRQLEIEYPPIHREPARARLVPGRVAPIRAGKRVTWEVHYKPHDGTPITAFEFEFAVRGPATHAEWRVLRPFAAAPTWVWETGGYAGEDAVRVRVRPAGEEPIEAATGTMAYTVLPSRVGPALVACGVLWMVGLVGVLAIQLAVEPRTGRRARLTVIDAPQGMPRKEVALSPMTGLRFLDEVRIGRATDVELPLGDDRLAPTQVRVRRVRLGPWVRTRLIVEPGERVYIDGVDLEPATHPLVHMTRLRMGEYEVRYDSGAPPPQLEVVCLNGHIVRGQAPNADVNTAPVLVVQSAERGVAPATVPFAEIVQVRCYRTPGEEERMRHRPGSATVSGPLVRVWFAHDTLTGRLEEAAAAERGRFRVYTDEGGGLAYVLVNAAATRKIKVIAGSEREATFTPRGEEGSGRLRLALGGPGPTAVGQRDIEASIERLHSEREAAPEAAVAPESVSAEAPPPEPAMPEEVPTADGVDPDPGDGEGAQRGRIAPPAPKPPAAPGSGDRYIHRRGKPRI